MLNEICIQIWPFTVPNSKEYKKIYGDKLKERINIKF